MSDFAAGFLVCWLFLMTLSAIGQAAILRFLMRVWQRGRGA